MKTICFYRENNDFLGRTGRIPVPAQGSHNFMTTFIGFSGFTGFSGFSEGLGIWFSNSQPEENSEALGKTRKTSKTRKNSKSGHKIVGSLCRHKDSPCPTYKINVFLVKTYGLE